jgi:hypothetical protein
VEPETAEEEEVPEPPKAKGRGRKAAEEKVEEQPVKKRGRVAKVKESEEVIELSSQDSESPKKAEKTPKKRAGKHVTIVTPSTELLKKQEESNEEAPSKSNSRKRQAQPELPSVSEEPIAKRPTRGKKK